MMAMEEAQEVEVTMDERSLDERFFEEWRRDMAVSIKDFRKESHDAVGRVELRLAAIDNRLADSQLVLDRHNRKISEIDDIVTQIDRRVDGLEKYHQEREIRRTLESEHAERRRSGLVSALITTAVCTSAGSLVTGLMGFLGWLLVTWIRQIHP